MTAGGSSDRYDVAIAGAGVSGLYAAWRLIEDARDRQAPLPAIVIFEWHDHPGGRLLTWLPAGRHGGLRAELGGMRFFEQQAMVWNLLGQLFPPEDIIPFHVNGDNLRLMLRGVSTSLKHPHPARARYRLEQRDQNKSAEQLVREITKDVLSTADNQCVLKRCLGGKQCPQNREQWDTVKPHLR
ncbi:MAG: NAD(P)/FAD-dependent oxidoreductase, partial [Solirubrobacterales bacterium]|nr:NAD(P)/FAD-dependent oxidoreductase [Solirubrobacterales bacterium]